MNCDPSKYLWHDDPQQSCGALHQHLESRGQAIHSLLRGAKVEKHISSSMSRCSFSNISLTLPSTSSATDWRIGKIYWKINYFWQDCIGTGFNWKTLFLDGLAGLEGLTGLAGIGRIGRFERIESIDKIGMIEKIGMFVGIYRIGRSQDWRDWHKYYPGQD